MSRVVVLSLLTLLLLSCDGGRPSADTAYAEGYRKGASDLAQEIERSAEASKNALRKAVAPKLLLGALVASLLTLIGDKLAEGVRRRVSTLFKLEPALQAKLAAIGFWAVAGIAIAILLSRHGPAPLPPTAILLGTAAWHLHQSYIPALLSGDKPKRSLALGKMKPLLFLVLVVAMVFELLSKESLLTFK